MTVCNYSEGVSQPPLCYSALDVEGVVQHHRKILGDKCS